MSRILLVGVLASAVLLVGCPDPNVIRCTQSADCPNRVNCVGGICVLPDGGPLRPDGGDGGGTDGGPTSCTAPPTLTAGGLVGPSSAPAGCRKPRGTPVFTGTVQQLGVRSAGTTFSFNVPPQTWSLTILSQAVDAGGPVTFEGPLENTVYAENVRDPASVLWYQTGASSLPPEQQRLFVPFSPPSPVTGATMVPNTSAALSLQSTGFPSGSWSVQLMDFSHQCALDPGSCSGGVSGGTYEVTILTRSGTPPGNGTLDVDFYLVTEGLGIDRNAAIAHPRVQRMVARLADLFAQQGVCLGNVQFWDVPQWAKDRYASDIDIDVEGPCSDLAQLFTLSQPSRRAIPLFLVDALVSNEGGGVALGVDGTIPGPGAVGGTIASGAAVTASGLLTESVPAACSGPQNLLSCGADKVAYVAAHEVGHFLGLYHTTEALGTEWDPLNDTTFCACEACRPSSAAQHCFGTADAGADPYYLVPSNCNASTGSCRGANNLMFWSVDTSVSSGQLTLEQGRIMRASPAVQ